MKLRAIKSQIASFEMLKTIIETKKIGVSLQLAKARKASKNVFYEQLFIKNYVLQNSKESYLRSIPLVSPKTEKETGNTIYLLFAANELKVKNINNSILKKLPEIKKGDIAIVISSYLDEESPLIKGLEIIKDDIIYLPYRFEIEKEEKDILRHAGNISELISSVILPMFKKFPDVSSIKAVFGATNVGYRVRQVLPMFVDSELNSKIISSELKSSKLKAILESTKEKPFSTFPTGIDFLTSVVAYNAKLIVLDAFYTMWSANLLLELFKLDNIIDEIEEKISISKKKFNVVRQELITSELAIISASLTEGANEHE